MYSYDVLLHDVFLTFLLHNHSDESVLHIIFSSNSDAVKNVWLASKTMYCNRLLFVRVVLTVYSLSVVLSF